MYPSSLSRRAISCLMREVGICAVSCIALLALRMRGSMSAIGSVCISFLLPAALRHARDDALVGELAQADPAQAELAEHRARPEGGGAGASGGHHIDVRGGAG